MPSLAREFIIGSRGSALARWQTNWVIEHLRKARPDVRCRVEYFSSAGDREADRPLPELGGDGVFTADLSDALLHKRIDMAVHSLKDMPTEDTPGLAIGAIGERSDAHDVLIGAADRRLDTLPAGARVGTCSLRRSAQLLAARPDLTALPIRGNVDTRVRKAQGGEYDAVLLAAAGLLRLGLGGQITQYLPFKTMLPAPGQGAIAVQNRADDSEVMDCLRPVDHAPTRRAVTAERAFLTALGGGCSAPIAAYAVDEAGRLTIQGLVAAVDGSLIVRVAAEGEDPDQLGRDLAAQAVWEGAGALLS